MIDPAGDAVARLRPKLREYGFRLVFSGDYAERFSRGKLVLSYTCGKYSEDLMGIITDAANYKFQMAGYLEVVDPDGFTHFRSVVNSNSVSSIDFIHDNFGVISDRYYAQIEVELLYFMKNWPEYADTVPADVASRMDETSAKVMARFGLPPDPEGRR